MTAAALSSWAMDEGAPKQLEFRDSLYRITAAGALH